MEGAMAAVIAICGNLKAITVIESAKHSTALSRCEKDGHSSEKHQQTAGSKHSPGDSIMDHNNRFEHNPLEHNPISVWLSNFQCDDVLCKINYTTLILDEADTVPLDGHAHVLSLAPNFISHIPEQLHRPPIV